MSGGPVGEDPVGGDLLERIGRARWFAGKGRRYHLGGLHPLPWLTPAGSWPAVRPEVAEIGYDDGTTEQYQLLLAYRRPGDEGGGADADWGTVELPDLGPVRRLDATRDPEAVTAVLHALLAQHVAGDADGEVRCRTVEVHPLRPDLAPRVFAGEQSNTSVMLGEVAMVKAFRRLEPGRNLDIEVHHALAGDDRARAAGLYGWIEADWRSGARRHSTDLAMVVEQLHQARDGWDLALASCAAGTDFSSEAHALGAALLGVHQALAEHFDTDRQNGAAVAATMTRRLLVASAQATELEPWVAELTELFGRLEPLQVSTQRVHGDFHLGQTLLTPQGWKIIDFEGEPLKSMDERRAPDSPWRDVAGLLRSLDYAAGSTAAAAATTADTAEVSQQAQQRARDWASACRSAFLAGYTGRPQPSAGPGASPGGVVQQDEVLLEVYQADKAVYEVLYEVRNRPAWVGIPLRAIEDLIDRTRADRTAENPAETAHGEDR